jgi:Icc-related predicted phosphoesterase
MLIYHFSDNHGRFEKLKAYVDANGLPDVFVMTGDFFPNCSSNYQRDKATEASWQETWMLKYMDTFQTILGGKPLLFCLGNHDYADLEDICSTVGIDAKKVPPTGMEYLGYKWAGFGHVPYLWGHWNREADEKLLGILTGEVVVAAPDFLLTHAPPFKILDKTKHGELIGIRPLYGALASGVLNPKYHFFGHVHEHGGERETIDGTTFVNSATTIQKVEI